MPTIPAAGEVWSDALTLAPEQPREWVWHGLIGPGNLTLLTGQPRAGKTTLLSVLLGLRVAGGQLGGLAVRPGKTLIITEETRELWAERARKHSFGASVSVIDRPFRTVPGERQWLGLLERVKKIRRRHGIDLVVFDSLARFLRCENNARAMLDALLPLTPLLDTGMAALLMHHPGRGERPLGMAARGSGALLGHVDVSIEMRCPRGDTWTRRRRLFTFSRHAVSPPPLMLELDSSGTAYHLVSETAEDQFEAAWEPIRLVLAEATQKLTRQDVHAEWPAGLDRPDAITVWRRLDRAREQGWVQCEGAGSKSDPFRYWLPEREATWNEDPLYRLMEQQRQALGLPFESLSERKEKLRQAGLAEGPTEGAA
jgi:hypothetical protein